MCAWKGWTLWHLICISVLFTVKRTKKRNYSKEDRAYLNLFSPWKIRKQLICFFVKNRKCYTLKNKHCEFYNSTLGQEEGNRKKLKQKGGIRTKAGEGGGVQLKKENCRTEASWPSQDPQRLRGTQHRSWSLTPEEGGSRNTEWELAEGEAGELLWQLLDSWGMES